MSALQQVSDSGQDIKSLLNSYCWKQCHCQLKPKSSIYFVPSYRLKVWRNRVINAQNKNRKTIINYGILLLLRKLTCITELSNWLVMVLRLETTWFSGLILSLMLFPFWGRESNSQFQEQNRTGDLDFHQPQFC